jgi:5'-nucleotidase
VLGDNLMEGVDPRGRPFYWIGPAKPEGGVTAGSDLRAMQEGKVSITPICLNLTHGPMVERLRPVFE